MPSLIDLRRRITSVKSTQQITRAMKMVAAAKLRRAQDSVEAARPYATELRKVVGNLAARVGESGHPLLKQKEENKVLLVAVTGDKGLCGAFNTNVIRRTREEIATRSEAADVELLLLGRRGADFFRRRPTPIRAEYLTLFAGVTYEDSAEIATDITRAFTDGAYDAVYVVYNQFVSVMNQKLTCERLLPLDTDFAADVDTTQEYIFEPSASEILEAIVPGYVGTQVHKVLLDSQAAEHAARMTAMDAATKNAGELIDSLTLTYNRSRQAAITKELIEVVSGAQALEG
ncbi:MAG: ATP synthase F1 subunit gamma [Acidobacteriota bacterium]|nr:ATP synthase F1 subunit gamma [Acidobacteriota bacterium]